MQERFILPTHTHVSHSGMSIEVALSFESESDSQKECAWSAGEL